MEEENQNNETCGCGAEKIDGKCPICDKEPEMPEPTEEKEGFMDKVKDVLHINRDENEEPEGKIIPEAPDAPTEEPEEDLPPLEKTDGEKCECEEDDESCSCDEEKCECEEDDESCSCEGHKEIDLDEIKSKPEESAPEMPEAEPDVAEEEATAKEEQIEEDLAKEEDELKKAEDLLKEIDEELKEKED